MDIKRLVCVCACMCTRLGSHRYIYTHTYISLSISVYMISCDVGVWLLQRTAFQTVHCEHFHPHTWLCNLICAYLLTTSEVLLFLVGRLESAHFQMTGKNYEASDQGIPLRKQILICEGFYSIDIASILSFFLLS